MQTIKQLGDGSLLILAVPFGGPLPGGRDADGEFFSHNTDLCLSWPPTGRPLLYDHALDADVGTEPIGLVDLTTARKTDEGWWITAQLSKSSRYWLAIRQLLAQAEDVLFASSGAYGHLVQREPSGEIRRWPLVEVSLTPAPSNYLARVTEARAKALKAAGLVLPAPPAVMLGDPDPAADPRAVLRSASVTILSARERLKQGR